MDKGTIIRMAFFVLSWINAAASQNGWFHLPVVSEEGVAIVVAFVVSVWTYWKNNNHTKSAQVAQGYLNSLKKEAKKNKG
jgi:SPP1 family holin